MLSLSRNFLSVGFLKTLLLKNSVSVFTDVASYLTESIGTSSCVNPVRACSLRSSFADVYFELEA